MKTALITTTINVPTVLSLYRRLDPDVRFFVALDKKTPTEAFRFCEDLPNTTWTGGPDPGYACSDLIGWNTIARRNIALLEALKWGAEVIVTIDDDNIPIDPHYFYHVDRVMDCDLFGRKTPFNGIQVANEWFDVGTLLDPVAPHRGFPHDRKQTPSYTSVTDARVGVAAGICLGDPDISAATRMVSGPVSHRVSELLRAGIVVDPRRTHTVFNSQNTSVIRELAPALFMIPQFKRFDDILASLVLQRLMRDRGYVTHFGQPFVFQQRNQHDLLKDLEAEMWGSKNILQFSAWLDGFVFTGKEAVTDCMRVMFTNPTTWMPAGVQELVLAWCDDVERVL